ncbi:histone-lysine N-methyltransferase SETD1B isoform X3 [Bicyclus anynana]|uniref:Histone-lysine N-methyltransferase SETD1B isoform X3 n=1 Tax=Bicyclus anynana TaxID=110368 RepID=A0ABM3LYL6_BICAN|nr:histone-lysine N-methyltransferase SETD1B isoform X3 [Bicyclus anynana]
MSDEMAVGDKTSSREIGDKEEMESADSVEPSEPPTETAAAESKLSSAPVEEPPDAEEDLPETIAAIIEQLGQNDDIDKAEAVEKNDFDINNENEIKNNIDIRNDPAVKDDDIFQDVKNGNEMKSVKDDQKIKYKEMKVDTDDSSSNKVIKEEENTSEAEISRGIKRRASAAFSDDGIEEFKGFEKSDSSTLPDYSRIVQEEWKVKRRPSVSSEDGFRGFNLIPHSNLTGYCQVLERLEAEVSVAVKSHKPLKTVMAAPTPRASKRARQDADSSRPSSALSSRSEGDGAVTTDSSPAGRASARRPTAEMSSPLLRVPLERGWRRELVYRAATADGPARRNADIYYYSPLGKKLRSTREVSEHLSGTGLTLENFSFFKEPLGIDDPEKEIIRDAKVLRRVESPVPVTPPQPLESKRTPKPKPPKGASPEPATVKSPPAKLKVKSMGSRLSSNGATPKNTKKQPQTQPQPQPQPQQTQPQAAPTPADNNNTAAWKKPRGPPPLQPRPPPPPPHAPAPAAHALREHHQLSRQVQQPCSLTCGRGVPSLACAACLCLYHPPCVGFVAAPPPNRFLCKNCRKSSSPPLEPPPLIHKSGVSTSAHHTQSPSAPSLANVPASVANVTNVSANVPANAPASACSNTPTPRRLPGPAPTKVQKSDKRVLLRMKVAGGGPDGERVWAVAKPTTPITPAPAPAPPPPAPVVPPPAAPVPAPAATPTAPSVCRPTLPQSLAILNGKRFIVVSRALHR